jgi:hypothetical protein
LCDVTRINPSFQSQEEALQQIGRSQEEMPASPNFSKIDRYPDLFSTEDLKKGSDSSEDKLDDKAAVHACHDLHIWLLVATGKDDEAKRLFKTFKTDGAKRMNTLKEFMKRTKVNNAFFTKSLFYLLMLHC